MIWRGMRLHKGFALSALVAVAVPAIVALTAISTLAAQLALSVGKRRAATG